MSHDVWTQVDQFFNGHLLPSDPLLDTALADAKKAGVPSWDVAPNQGQLLHLLAATLGAQKILEVGTLAGYSTIFMARALPAEGLLVSLEYEPKHAEVATTNIAKAGLADRVQIRVGKAIDTLPKLEAEGLGPFDMAFLDADKASNPDYFQWALKLSRKGGLIIVDNVVRNGEVLEASSDDPDIKGIRRLAEMIETEPRVTAAAIQTVGSKGYDGFILARVN